MPRFHKKGEHIDAFVLTLPLKASKVDKQKLDRIFRCGNVMLNNLIAYARKQINQLERTREWRGIQVALHDDYAKCEEKTKQLNIKLQAKEKILQTGKKDKILSKEITALKKDVSSIEKEIKSLCDRRTALIEKYSLTANKIEAQIAKYRVPYTMYIHSWVAQNIAARVYTAVEKYFYGNGKKITFSPCTSFLSISGKKGGGIVYDPNGHTVTLCQKSRKFTIPVGWTKDKHQYEKTALKNEVAKCAIIRKWYPNGWTYMLQITLYGKPPVKVNPQTGEALHPLGKGRVGHDIGPQTLATVGDESTNLCVLAENVQSIDNKLRIINRALDRSRRTTNPRMFNDKGEIARIDHLSPECVNKYGKRKWVKSKRYVKLEARRRYLYRLQAEQRTQAHNELANKLIVFGDIHFIEKMNFSALAKRAKKTEVSEKTGRMKRKKRFGKSIANKAPAEFVNILEKKVTSNGGSFYKVDTYKCKASQYDHTNKAYKKKHLSQRWHVFDDGSKVQRDLYSAFLLQNTNNTLDGFVKELLDTKYPHFKEMHDKKIAALADGANTVSSMGIKVA